MTLCDDVNICYSNTVIGFLLFLCAILFTVAWSRELLSCQHVLGPKARGRLRSAQLSFSVTQSEDEYWCF